MEDEEINFDTDAAPQPSSRKLSRLKKAGVSEARRESKIAPAASPENTVLHDLTNTQPSSSAAPQHMPAASQSSSDASASKIASEVPSPASVKASPARSQDAEQDYWDSEDELEAELTKRERAEGFHVDSPSASGC